MRVGWRAGLAVAGLVLVGSGAAAVRSGQAARDTHENLHALLWMQTSAEYEAITRGLFHLAAVQLDRALQDPRWTAIPEQAARADLPTLRPAVILDVDETVLSNSLEEGQRIFNREPFDPALFDRWVRQARATAVPGAGEFVRYAASRDVDVYYLTNRSADQKAPTVTNLTALGMPASPERVLCLGDDGTQSDKDGRRRHVAADHRVVLLLGDDLNDFESVSDPASGRLYTPAERSDLVAQSSGYWQERWFVLPNPVYGSWERALYPSGLSDADTLARQRAAVQKME
jgi:5'-nucleotidase (lipoprotein e(P4) family)